MTAARAFRSIPTDASAGRLARAVRDELPLLAGIAAYPILAAAIFAMTGTEDAFTLPSDHVRVWSLAFFFIFPTLYLGVRTFWVVHRISGRRRIAFRAVFPESRIRQLVTGLAILFLLMIFQGAFTSIKTAMPAWQGGFPHDVAQADLDRWLHLGVDPWRYLYAVTDSAWMLRLVEWNYSQGWFLLCFGMLFWIAVSPRASGVRSRYVVTYLATWIVVGNLLALVFLSAGPAYYGLVTGDTGRFADQMALLHRSEGVMHSAVQFQAYLWYLHEHGVTGIGSGISAFPSMHVAFVTLNALFLAELFGKRVGMAAGAYVVVILVSSVYLAWHYAIDGYAAIAVTLLIYLAVRRLFRIGATRAIRAS